MIDKENTRPWMGGRFQNVNSGFQWSDGSQIAAEFWAAGEPSRDGDCVQIDDYRQLNDVGCEKSLPFVCENKS